MSECAKQAVVKSMNANNDPEKTTLGHGNVIMALLSHERHMYEQPCICI